MKKIILTSQELTYLKSKKILSKPLFYIVKTAKKINNLDKYRLLISEDDMDKIRNSCGEQLQLFGFDKNYNLTKDGEMLENLIDVFYID